MNKKYILYNLKEAKEQLDEVLLELENNSEYDFGEFSVDIQHLYHHVNTAWNSKYSTKQESSECSEEHFNQWRKFPNDIDL
jgi:hypothetical protein